MPAPIIAASASPSAPIAPVVAAATDLPGSAVNEGGASAFASLLVSQLVQQATKDIAGAMAESEPLPAVEAATATTEAGDEALATLLPFLLENIAAALKGEEPATAARPPETEGAADPLATAFMPLIGAVGNGIAAALESGNETAGGGTAASLVAAGGKDTAILAATEGNGATAAAETGKGSFDGLLAASRESAQAVAAATGNTSQTHGSRTAAVTQLPVQTPVSSGNWGNDVGNQLVWMVGRQESRAELVLTPPHLGRIEVSLTVSGDQANATFVSASPAVREALENALPRLREVLADAGVSLGQTQVGAETAGNQANEGQNKDNRPRDGREDDSGQLAAVGGGANQWQRSGRGLVDVFA